MKKHFFVLIMFVFIPFCIKAHPPKKVVITYDKATSTAKIVVTHPVNDVKTHFVKSVVISVDGKEVKTINETQQQTNTTETVEIVLTGIKPGMKIEAIATCNIMGSKKGKLDIQ